MSFNKTIICIIFSLVTYSCTEYNKTIKSNKPEKKYYSSSGFALIYEDQLFDEKIVNIKINNEDYIVIHNFLKKNTPIQIINPNTSKVYNTKVYKTADYPGIFNIVISKKIASFLELDSKNPYIEIIEVKKNKTFIAKESNTFDEEKKVAGTAPIDEIKMDDLTQNNETVTTKVVKNYTFILVVGDFYYLKSAEDLKKELFKQSNIDNLFINKIANNSYRLAIGPFENFNALKSTYISLNNLGFDSLNIQRKLK